MKYPHTLPCGYQIKHAPFVRGRSKELLQHYKVCEHEYCKGRRDEWQKIVTQFAKERATQQKGAT